MICFDQLEIPPPPTHTAITDSVDLDIEDGAGVMLSLAGAPLLGMSDEACM